MELAATLVFPFFLVFCRLGAALLVFPALSDDAVPARLRLLAAVAAAAVMVPLLTPTLPTLPGTTGELALLVFAELVMGLLLGLVLRGLRGKRLLEVLPQPGVIQTGLLHACTKAR